MTSRKRCIRKSKMPLLQGERTVFDAIMCLVIPNVSSYSYYTQFFKWMEILHAKRSYCTPALYAHRTCQLLRNLWAGAKLAWVCVGKVRSVWTEIESTEQRNCRDYFLLGYNIILCCSSLLTFRRNVLPSCSEKNAMPICRYMDEVFHISEVITYETRRCHNLEEHT